MCDEQPSEVELSSVNVVSIHIKRSHYKCGHVDFVDAYMYICVYELNCEIFYTFRAPFHKKFQSIFSLIAMGFYHWNKL